MYREPTRPPKKPPRVLTISRVPRFVFGIALLMALVTGGGTALFFTRAIEVTCTPSSEGLSCEAWSRSGLRTSEVHVSGARIDVSTTEHQESSDDGTYTVRTLTLSSEGAQLETLPLDDPAQVEALAASLNSCLQRGSGPCAGHARTGWLLTLLVELIGLLGAAIVLLAYPIARIEHDQDEGTVRLFVGRVGWTRLVYAGPRADVRFRQRFDIAADEGAVHVLEAIVDGAGTHKLARGRTSAMKERETAVNAFLDRGAKPSTP